MRRMLTLVALLIAASAFAQDVGVVNGAFEGDEDGDGIADGWAFSAGADAEMLDVSLSLEPGREGGTAQKIECTHHEDGHAMVCQMGTVAIERGEWYRMEVWLRAEERLRVSVGIHDIDGWVHCGLWQTVHASDRWRRYSWRFQGEHDCHETSRLQIWFSSTGTLWVDDLVLERIEAPAQANIIEDIDSKNLVPNSSFEAGADGWLSAGHWRLFGEVAALYAVHGSRHMKVMWRREDAPVFSFDYYDMRRDPYTRPAITSEGWMRVEEGAAYVLSAWVRADREVPGHLRALGPSRQYAGTTVTLGREWERFELPFTPNEDLCSIQVDVDCDEAEVDELTFRVDAVQLERGEAATEYRPRRRFEVGLLATNGTGIYHDGDRSRPAMVLQAFNDLKTDVRRETRLAVRNGFDEMVAEQTVDLQADAGDRSIHVLSLRELPHGFYRAELTGEDVDPCSVRLAILPDLSLRDSPFGMNHAYGWDPYIDLAREIGVLWVRDWSLKWDHVEPEPGRWEFEMARYQIDRPLDRGMNVLCMFPFPSATWCSTAPPLEEIDEKLSRRAPYRIRTAYAPRDPAELEQYAYECVRRFGERINVWEVFNESIFTNYALPGLAGYEATDYIPLLEAVYRGCKRADPDCLVMGGYSTPPGNFERLHRPFIEGGGLDSCDLYSLHIYPGGEPEFIAGELDRITDLMREHGGVKPMWMTEYAYYGDDDPDPFPHRWPRLVESELTQAAWNTRMCVTQLAHGVEKVFYHVWHTRANRDSGARIFFEYGGAPRKIAASQAAMAQVLGPDPQFLREVEIGEDASCYIFRGADDAPVALVWLHWDERECDDLTGFEVTDLFGAPVEDAAPGLSPHPIFIIARDESPATFAAALKEALAP